MSIIEKIKHSVECATGLRFYYDSPETLNVRVDNLTLPCAMLDVVESGAVFDENGVVRERLNIQVLFADKTQLDYDGIENESEHLDWLKRKAFQWLLGLRRSDDLRLVGVGNTQRYYATQDAIVTAYGVQVNIEEMEGVCYGNNASQGGCGCNTHESA